MAYFYGAVQGHHDTATRTGTRSSGIEASANSWNIGGEVTVLYSDILKTDVATFYHTDGSNTSRTRLASFAVIDGKHKCIETDYPEVFI